MKHGIFRPHAYRTFGGWVIFLELPGDRVARGFGSTVREACADFKDTLQQPIELAFRREPPPMLAGFPQVTVAP